MGCLYARDLLIATVREPRRRANATGGGLVRASRSNWRERRQSDVCPAVSVPTCLSVSLYLSVYLSVYLSLSICLSISLSLYLFLSICLSLSLPPSVCLSIAVSLFAVVSVFSLFFTQNDHQSFTPPLANSSRNPLETSSAAQAAVLTQRCLLGQTRRGFVWVEKLKGQNANKRSRKAQC